MTISNKTMLSYSTEKLSNSLLLMPDEFSNKIAVEMFGLILNYMQVRDMSNRKLI
jgi:hypothetical protein